MSHLPPPVFDSGARRAKRSNWQRTGLHQTPLSVEAFEVEEHVPLEIGNTEEINAFYTTASKRLQLINCPLLAGNMITIIQRHKQVRHPYNSRRKPGGASGENGSPEDTKPDCWPLLVQNLRFTEITADALEEAVVDTRGHLVPEDNAEEEAILIVKEIIRVRRTQERYRRDELGKGRELY